MDNSRIGKADAYLIIYFLRSTFVGSRVLSRGHDSLRAGDAEHIPAAAGTCAVLLHFETALSHAMHLGIMF